MKYDADLTEALRDKLEGLDLGGFVAPTEPEKRTARDMRDVLRPSNLHKCGRALALTLRALPFESEWSIESLTAVDYGTHVHRKIQAALPDLAHEIKVTGPWLQGSMDTAWCAAEFDDTAIDWKTIGHKSYQSVKKAGQAKAEHVTQLTWYARHYGSSRGAVVYVVKPDGSLPDVLDPDMIEAYSGDVPQDEHPYDAKAAEILAHHEAGTLPEYTEISDCRWCPVLMPCLKARLADAPSDELRTIHSKINGTTFRDLDLGTLGLEVGMALTLERDPENPWDLEKGNVVGGRAVATKVLYGDVHLGFLPANGAAPIVAEHLDAGGLVVCEIAELTGGTENKANRGINLRLRLT